MAKVSRPSSGIIVLNEICLGCANVAYLGALPDVERTAPKMICVAVRHRVPAIKATGLAISLILNSVVLRITATA